MVLFQNIVRGLQEPFFKEFLNRHIASRNRATVLSVKSCVSGVAQFAGLGIFGVMLGIWGLPTCLQVLGVFVLIAGAIGIYDHVRVVR
jgi:hypothetical protein